MIKKKKIVLGIIAAVIVAGTGFLSYRYSINQKQVQSLSSQVDNLKDELKQAKDKLSELEDENSELEEKLSNVKHFNDDGTIGRGFTVRGTNYTGQVLETKIDGDFEGW